MAMKLRIQTDIVLDPRKLKARVDDAMAGFVLKSATDMMEDSRANAPVDTGELRDSHEAVATGHLEAEARVNAPHGVWVELGTARRPATPFFTPAEERARARFAVDAAKAAREALGGG